MSDWLTLRDYLTQSVDDEIAAEPDAEARAMMTYHRARIVDCMELALLRRFMAEREDEEQPQVVRINGHRVARAQ